MSTAERRAATAAYKKREAIAGIYLVRSSGSSGQWVGHTQDVDAIRNRVWFSLRTGAHTNRELQAAWDRDGEGSFDLEPLEFVDKDALGLDPIKTLRALAALWRDKLGADAV